MAFFDTNSFPTNIQAQLHLERISKNKNIVTNITDFLCRWKFNSEYDLSVVCEDIDNIVNAIKIEFFGDENESKISGCINCVVHNLLWDNIKSILRAKYTQDDQQFFEKSTIFCKNKMLPLHSDDTTYCSVPYTAAIVELSMWDSYNSPLEKLNCLCVTFDIIFAELKSALVTVISKYSEKELEIPIINNEDVIPIISLVVMKSKLRYGFSNLMYIKLFGKNCLSDINKCYILQTFEEAILKILNEDQQSLYLESRSSEERDIDFREVMKKMSLNNNKQKEDSLVNPDLKAENKERLLSLILTATTSNKT